MKRLASISATAMAAAIVLAGCGSPADAPPPAASESNNMPGTMSGSMPAQGHGGMSASSPAITSQGAEHNSADAMFARMMLPHHEQAVTMSDIMLDKKGLDPRITELATQIKAAQGPEITTMTGWLAAWGEPSTMPGGHSMDGMVSDEGLAKLKAAQGTDAEKLFLTQMIGHHEGAVKMAQTETANGSNADAVALANSIITSQEKEIQEMKDLLKAL